MVKVCVLGRNVTRVPVLPSDAPTSFKGASATPWAKRMKCSLPPRQMLKSKRDDSAFTTETPTPCKPPETL